jgi:hypothetical protein
MLELNMTNKSFELAILGGAAALAGAASGAAAQDFSGLYSGVNLSFSVDGTVESGPFFTPFDYSLNGNSGGLFAGYNFVQGNWVFGAELGWSDGFDIDFAGETYGTLANIVDVRARAGTVFGNTLVYGALGWWKGEIDDFIGPAGTPAIDVDGMSFGLGFETAMGPKSFLGAEITRRNGSADDLFGINYLDDVDLTTASIRAGFRF